MSENLSEDLLNKMICNETIYEAYDSRSSSTPDLQSTLGVSSEKVQNLASEIYDELQKIMDRYPDLDEQVASGLMPLIVNVLESLDLAIIDAQQSQVELELCKDDKEILIAAFEKVKKEKKKYEEKLLEVEYHQDEERQQQSQKIHSLENIVKMFELKAKNASDHAARLEEREADMKNENSKLHTRLHELMRSHCEVMERMRILMNQDEILNVESTGVSGTNFKSMLNKKLDLQSYSSPCEECENGEVKGPTTLKQAWIDTELSLEDTSIIEDLDDIPKDKDSLSLTGMEKEFHNLIRENEELSQTKHALNIVKDDLITEVDELQSKLTMAKDENIQLSVVKDKLKARIEKLEEELKNTRNSLKEAELKLATHAEDDEEGISMLQRKRFTRVEMARVLLERNQFKERLMELQESLRCAETARANKEEGEKKAIWRFFSNLFRTSNTSISKRPTSRTPTKPLSVHYTASNAVHNTPALDAMKKLARSQPGELILLSDSEASDRSRSLKAVRAHVNRTQGDRIQAYGWSIAGANEDGSSKIYSIPVPIHCRPLNTVDIGMKIWCAAAVDLTGGEAGFPGSPHLEKIEIAREAISDPAIADLETELSNVMDEQNDFDDKKLSTFAWICNVSHSKSKVTIVNIKNNPSEILDSFNVKTHLLCIASVPGAKVNDMHGLDGIDLKQVVVHEVDGEMHNDELTKETEKNTELNKRVIKEKPAKEEREKANKSVTFQEKNELQENDFNVEVEENDVTSSIYQPMSTCLPTMWLGGQNNVLYVHSGIAQWSCCIFRIKLPDSILQITHFRGRMFVALADGKCCIFTRFSSTGEWDFSKYVIIDMSEISTNDKSIAQGNTTATHNIRCLEVTKSLVWLGYRNCVYILDPITLKIAHSFAVHSKKDSQVRHLAAMGDGVWCSMRMDSTIRLYSSLKPYQHLQDVDIDPCITRMLSPKAFSFIRITALKASRHRLWIGTSSGVILSIPCDKGPEEETKGVAEGGAGLALTTFIPKCNPGNAQLSYHGHKDAVKFFVCAKTLIMSGGEGYIDFRCTEEEVNSLSTEDRSHLIVWDMT